MRLTCCSTYEVTLGGLCLSRAGHILKPGDPVELQDNLRAEVLETQGARVLTVKLQKATPPVDAPAS